MNQLHEHDRLAPIRRFSAILARITTRWFPVPVTIEAEDSPLPGRVRLVMRCTWPDRYVPGTFTMRMTNDQLSIDASESTIVRGVRNLLGVILLHELDETFCLDGRLFDDPHAAGPNAVACFCPESPCECKYGRAA